jgi:putative membrane protein insertion efficiency factor
VPAGQEGGCDEAVRVAVAPGRRVAIGVVRLYQLIVAPWLGPACRFEPTCSRYAAEAIERHGLATGCGLAIRRVVRCNPLGGSGYDPVP